MINLRKIFLYFGLSIALGMLIATRVHADDNYNFYFQKAPGPQTVNQGGAATTAVAPQTTGQSPPPSDAQNVTKTETKAAPKKKEFSRWELSFGEAFLPDSQVLTGGSVGNLIATNEWVLGAQYNFTSLLGMDIRVLQPVGQSLFDSGTVNFALGIDVTPFRFNFFGYHALDITFTGGMTSFPSIVTANQIQTEYTSYGGAKVGFNLGHDISLTGGIEEISAIGMSRYSLAAAIKL